MTPVLDEVLDRRLAKYGVTREEYNRGLELARVETAGKPDGTTVRYPCGRGIQAQFVVGDGGLHGSLVVPCVVNFDAAAFRRKNPGVVV